MHECGTQSSIGPGYEWGDLYWISEIPLLDSGSSTTQVTVIQSSATPLPPVAPITQVPVASTRLRASLGTAPVQPDRSREAMLERLLDEAQRSHAIIEHAKTVEIERLTEEVQFLRMVIVFPRWFLKFSIYLYFSYLFFSSTGWRSHSNVRFECHTYGQAFAVPLRLSTRSISLIDNDFFL